MQYCIFKIFHVTKNAEKILDKGAGLREFYSYNYTPKVTLKIVTLVRMSIFLRPKGIIIKSAFSSSCLVYSVTPGELTRADRFLTVHTHTGCHAPA